jgi:hypothetical protein
VRLGDRGQRSVGMTLLEDAQPGGEVVPAQPGGAEVRSVERWSAVAAGIPDPCCPDGLPPGCVYGNPDAPASVLSLPGALPQPWAARGPVP